MTLVGKAHSTFVYGRRVRVLSERLAAILPTAASTVDVGAGDGMIDSLIMKRRRDLTIRGVDVLVRPDSHIEVEKFDGVTLPYEDQTQHAVMFIDVLHHTLDPVALLREAMRVSKRWIVIKDHTRNGFMAGSTLRFMDWVGNKAHGVALPYNYWPEPRWRRTFDDLGLIPEVWESDLRLYPFPAHLLFDRQLHFITRLAIRS